MKDLYSLYIIIVIIIIYIDLQVTSTPPRYDLEAFILHILPPALSCNFLGYSSFLIPHNRINACRKDGFSGV